MDGYDRHTPTYTLDSAAYPEQVNAMIKDFKKFAHTEKGVNIDNLSPL
jgi:hypothetical protein